jgi:formylglycine-generating enzyme required for sulfatase activity
MAPKVFISYASADKVIADRICSALEHLGVPCWIAPRDIRAGVDFPAAIVQAVNSVLVLVLILTEEATASPHVLTEVSHAFNGRKRIIPFRLSLHPLSADFEYFLSTTQWLDAPDGCTDQNLRRLTEATQQALAGEESLRPSSPIRRRTRLLVVAISVLVVAAAMIVYWRWLKSRTADSAAKSSSAVIASPPPKTWVNPADGQTYVWIAPGTFTMGCSAADGECNDNERPAHPVVINKGFWLGQTEVTIAAYRKFAAKHHLKSPAGDDALPVTEVTWAGAGKYCASIGGRLPTEAEWEYAARGGSPQAYYGVVPEIAWYADNSDDALHAVGKKQPNAFGLYDMLGNVKEWVLDRYYKKYYLNSAATGTGVDRPLASNATAVARGGSWMSDAASIRVSFRSEQETDTADNTIGIRCANDHP